MEKIFLAYLLRSTLCSLFIRWKYAGFCFLNPIKIVMKKLTKVYEQKLFLKMGETEHPMLSLNVTLYNFSATVVRTGIGYVVTNLSRD